MAFDVFFSCRGITTPYGFIAGNRNVTGSCPGWSDDSLPLAWELYLPWPNFGGELRRLRCLARLGEILGPPVASWVALNEKLLVILLALVLTVLLRECSATFSLLMANHKTKVNDAAWWSFILHKCVILLAAVSERENNWLVLFIFVTLSTRSVEFIYIRYCSNNVF